MDLLLAEINRKRKVAEEIRQNSSEGPKSKYLRQRDIIAHQIQQKEEEQRKLDEKRATRDQQTTLDISTSVNDQNGSLTEVVIEPTEEKSIVDQMIQKDDDDITNLEQNAKNELNSDNSKKYDSESDNEDEKVTGE